mmetsp:Transcript_41424/g.88280  ORF Transcript_41424/g.88280 Transcript_41424/m.88280 type:complete len:349 (-) Transcript_41424:1003-2049(-)
MSVHGNIVPIPHNQQTSSATRCPTNRSNGLVGRFLGVNDTPLEDAPIHLDDPIRQILPVRIQELIVDVVRVSCRDDLFHLLQHELKADANVRRQVHERHVLPSRLLARLNILLWRQPIVDHVRGGERRQLLLAHPLPRSTHEVAEDEHPPRPRDAQSLPKRLGFGEGVHERVLAERYVERVGLKGTFLVRARDDRHALAEPGVSGSLGRERVLLLAQVEARRLLDSVVFLAEAQRCGARAAAEVDVRYLALSAPQLRRQIKHVVRHLLAGLPVGTLLVQIYAVPLAEVDVGSAVAHDLRVEFELFLRVVLRLHALHVFREVARFAVDGGVDLSGDFSSFNVGSHFRGC